MEAPFTALDAMKGTFTDFKRPGRRYEQGGALVMSTPGRQARVGPPPANRRFTHRGGSGGSAAG